MKKQLILILFLLGNLTTSFSNNNTLTNKKTAFNDLIGTYQGFTLTEEGLDNANQIVVELTADFNLKITENFDGLFVEHINEKISPQSAGLIKTDDYAFDFKPASEESEFSIIRVLIHEEPVIPNSDFKVSFAMKGKEDSFFSVKKEGGNPKKPVKDINFSDIYEATSYTGKTQDNTFGDFKVEWFPSHKLGYLRFAHLRNVFKIERKNKYYIVTNETNQTDFKLKYYLYDNEIIKSIFLFGGKNLFDSSIADKYKYPKSFANDKENMLAIGSSIYDMIFDRFKVVEEDYTFTHNNKLNGKGMQIVFANNDVFVYSGGFKDGLFHGEGKITLKNGLNSGSFQDGERYGHFYISLLDGSQGSGEYVNGVQEGLWKVKQSNGATFDLIFQNGKKISTTATNKGVKNTQIAKHVEDADYQLKNSKRYVQEMVGIVNGCTNRTTMRSYQVCLRPLKRKIDLFTGTIVAADKELAKAIKETKRIGCAQSLQILKNAEKGLWEANGSFGDAYKAVTEVYHASTVSTLKAEFRKCKVALGKAAEAMDEYFYWINALTLETCYEYSSTDNSTLPSRKSSSKSSSSQSTSSSNNKTTSQNSTSVTSTTVIYPAFTGKYEGDNLLLLLGRKVDDPAVQKLLKNPKYKFERKDRSGSLREKIDYECYPYRFSLSFVNGVMTYISFEVKEWDNEHYFKKKLPLNIPLAKSTSAMKRMKDKWKHNDYGSSSNWTLEKYQLKFNVYGGGENDDIHIVNINGEDIKDWNSYYQQFQ